MRRHQTPSFHTFWETYPALNVCSRQVNNDGRFEKKGLKKNTRNPKSKTSIKIICWKIKWKVLSSVVNFHFPCGGIVFVPCSFVFFVIPCFQWGNSKSSINRMLVGYFFYLPKSSYFCPNVSPSQCSLSVPMRTMSLGNNVCRFDTVGGNVCSDKTWLAYGWMFIPLVRQSAKFIPSLIPSLYTFQLHNLA